MGRERTIIDEEGFEPCRDERCSIRELHPCHKEKTMSCQSCGADLIKMPRKRARCSQCSWRGLAPSKPKQKPKKPRQPKVVMLHA